MGLRKPCLNYILKMLKDNKREFKNLEMCELGNQIFPGRNWNGFKTGKQYFKSLGIKHTSIDWNGKDGALPLNMNEPIDIGQFDVVTNLGVTEHIENHEQGWENIYNLTKPGGIIINISPKKGNYVKHECFRWYVEKWFYGHAKERGYKILDIGIINPKNEIGFDAIKCTFKKEE